MAKTPRYSAPALEKGLAVLECLADRGTPQSLTDLARALDRSSSELFRMLSCLEQAGYIRKDAGTGAYGLTLKLYQLAHVHSPMEKLLQAALPLMRQLSDRVEESCHLAALDHGHIVILARAEGPQPIRLAVEVGAAFPASRTVSGRMLLAHLPEAERAEQLTGDPAYRRMNGAERKRFAGKLAEICRSGYSTAENETIVGVRDAAVLVGNPKAGVMAALAMPTLTSMQTRRDHRELLAELKHCAGQITHAIGLTP